MQKNILCFGDSNTWGYIPGTGERYAPEVRWPGVMAAALGAGYHISEDGLNGRTTGFDFPWADCRGGLGLLGQECCRTHPQGTDAAGCAGCGYAHLQG